jgi:hypothetical protein
MTTRSNKGSWVLHLGVGIGVPLMMIFVMVLPVVSELPGWKKSPEQWQSIRSQLSSLVFLVALAGAIQFVRKFRTLWEREERGPALPAALGALAMMLSFPLGFVVGANLTSRAEAKAIQRAELVVRALDQYQQEQGAYPQVLKVLVPKYLPAVPRPGAAYLKPFNYHPPTSPTASYSLWIGMPGIWSSSVSLVYDPSDLCSMDTVKLTCEGRRCRCRGDWKYIQWD